MSGFFRDKRAAVSEEEDDVKRERQKTAERVIIQRENAK